MSAGSVRRLCMLRWQHLTPGRRLRGLDGAQEALQQLRGVTVCLGRACGSERSCRRASPDGPPRVLDHLTRAGSGSAAAISLAWSKKREDMAGFHAPTAGENDDAPPGTEVVRAKLLERRGLLFVADLAQTTSLPPSVVRQSLWSLVRRGLVTNDRIEVARRGEPVAEMAPQTDCGDARNPPRHRSGGSLVADPRAASDVDQDAAVGGPTAARSLRHCGS